MKKTIQFHDKAIAYTILGQGNALVLLHGFTESKAIWDGFMQRLQNNFKVIAIDLPGHGESKTLADIHTMQLMAAVVKKVLDTENISDFVVSGHSMGGYVALQLAEMYPQQVKGLALFHSHVAPDSEQARENRNRTIEIVKQNRQKFIYQFIPDLFDSKNVKKYAMQIEKLQQTALAMQPQGIIAALAGMRERSGYFDVLAKAEMPVLFIAGKQDSRINYMQVFEQAALASHSEVLLLNNVGHMGYIEASDITLRALKHFALRCYGE